MTKQEKKQLWIGIGIGVSAGVVGGFFIGNTVTKRRTRKELKKVREAAYIKGARDAEEEAKLVIDELKNNTIMVNSTDDPAEIKKAINAHFGASDAQMTQDSSDGSEAVNGAFLGQTEASTGHDDDIYVEKVKKDVYELPEDMNFIGITASKEHITFANGDEPPITYPKWLFLNNDGSMRDVLDIRKDLKLYDHSIRNLCVVWNKLGWGTYIAELDGSVQNENIDSYNLDIDDDTLGDEPMEKTIERQRYLDEIDRYQAHPEEAPRIISRQDFEEDNYLEKRYIDYYDKDNVFVESNDVDTPIDDPFSLTGVVNGQDLFAHKNRYDDDSDPDIVHVKNFAMNSVFEITRWHKSYASIRDGSAYINGSTD